MFAARDDGELLDVWEGREALLDPRNRRRTHGSRVLGAELASIDAWACHLLPFGQQHRIPVDRFLQASNKGQERRGSGEEEASLRRQGVP
jgi:hypothetical protein